MKEKLWTIILIILSTVLTLGFSSFTPLLLLLTVPGLLFGFALTLPRVYLDPKSFLKPIKKSTLYPIIWAIHLCFYLIFQLITKHLADKTPYIILGLFAGLSIYLTFNWQFGFKNKILGMLIICFLSIVSLLIFDHFFPSPHEKELNIGKQIAFWQILVGLGILTIESKSFSKFVMRHN